MTPSPGLPERHPLFAVAAGAEVPVRSELELAYGWEQTRAGGPRPMVAVTGTDGKTTTTLMATAMVEASGRRAAAAGNTELPLVEAIDRDVDAFVVECSSFRLVFTERFRTEAAVWLNLAPDHQDWHLSMAGYEEAKARLWDHQQPADAAIGNADDPIVMARLATAPGRHVTFGDERRLPRRGRRAPRTPGRIDRHRRPAPRPAPRRHRRARRSRGGAGGGRGDGGRGRRRPGRLRARLGTGSSWSPGSDGVEWYDDSKATTPHAAATAIRGFDDVVLLAGGRNKGFDLGPLGEVATHVRAVVALGEAADEVAKVFHAAAPELPVTEARSMADAVDVARGLARTGDTVLLSPACASFDWYSSYGERGDDFARLVHELQGVEG